MTNSVSPTQRSALSPCEATYRLLGTGEERSWLLGSDFVQLLPNDLSQFHQELDGFRQMMDVDDMLRAPLHHGQLLEQEDFKKNT